MPIFRNFGNDPTLALLRSISEGIDNLGASFASSLSGLENFDFDFPVFNHTELKSVNLLPDTPVLVLPRESLARRNTLKNAQSSTGIIIFVQGIENPGIEDFLKSPWRLSPGSFREDDRDGGYPIWAMAVGGAAKVEVAIEYPSEQHEEIPMKIQGILGVGNNWINFQRWTQQEAGPTYGSTNFDSDINNGGNTGYKIFQITQFEPGKDYTVSVEVDAAVTFKSTRIYPIDCYFFSIESLLKTGFYSYINPYVPTDVFDDKWAKIQRSVAALQELSFLQRLPPSGGNLLLTPDSGRYLGFFKIAVDNENYMETAILNWSQSSPETGTFSITGY